MNEDQKYIDNIPDFRMFAKTRTQAIYNKLGGQLPNIFCPYNKSVIKKYAPTLTTHCGIFGTTSSSILIKAKDFRLRKLTPFECWKLMGFCYKDFLKAENTLCTDNQLYKQAGNSVCVDVVYGIYKSLYNAMPYLFDNLKVLSCFSGIGAFEKALDDLYINDIQPRKE